MKESEIIKRNKFNTSFSLHNLSKINDPIKIDDSGTSS